MEKIDNTFVEKFNLKELTIKNTGSWIISLRPQQPTLGSLILTLNRKCESLSQITEIEGRELSIAFKDIGKILKSTFNPDKINYLALMMIDSQVHFHVIPRYANKVLLDDNEYKDTNWPGPPSLEPIELSPKQILSILILLKNRIVSI